MTAEEAPLDPEQPIIDAHLHLWDISPASGPAEFPHRFLLSDANQTIERSGQRITHSIYVECHAMYRRDGPPEMRPVGEVEFANGQAAMSASGRYGACRMAERIVGNADLSLGTAVKPVLEALSAAGGERFCGVRNRTAFSAAGLFGSPGDPGLQDRLRDTQFQAGARILADMGLCLDVWCVHRQLDSLADLADALPDLCIVLDHIGTPELRGTGPDHVAEVQADWRTKISHLALRPNVAIKLGGLGMDISRPIGSVAGTVSSETLADLWRPWFEYCIDAFSPRRCMFESNFPPDRAAGTYGATWNAFKRIARQYSADEKEQLFRQTAAKTYGITSL